ncbi:MAG: hypothetical protein AB7U99_02390 [Steroidobacteraceae bacterium]
MLDRDRRYRAKAVVTTEPERPMPGALKWTGHADFHFEHGTTPGRQLFGEAPSPLRILREY